MSKNEFFRNDCKSCIVNKTKVFCVLLRNSIWPPKNGRKAISEKKTGRSPHIPSQHFQNKCVLNSTIQDGCQKWRENDFWQNLEMSFHIPYRPKISIKIALSHTISEITVFLYLMQKLKIATKNGGKMIYGKIAI